MTDIDWSKAPDDATHAFFHAGNFLGWRKLIDGTWHSAYEESCKWLPTKGPMEERYVLRPTQWGPYTTVEAAPQPWSGEDGSLPPVGTVCETLWSSTRGEYVTALILAHDENRAVYRLTSGERKGEYESDVQHTNYGEHLPIFRPIRTAEQIAADDRKKAVEQLCSDSKGHAHPPICFAAAESLYDAGYRKVQS